MLLSQSVHVRFLRVL